MSLFRAASACVVGIALVFSAAPLPAQSEEPASRGQIVVTGETPDAITALARNVSIIGNPLDNPLPRFEDRLCPGVLGLEAEAAAYVIQRIRFNAEQYDIPQHPDDGTCKPNMIVAFIEDAQDQLVELARNQGYMLAGLSVSQRGELLDAPGAARVWVNTAVRTATGMPVSSQSAAGQAPERVKMADAETGTGNSLDLPAVARGWATQSRITFATREDIVSVMVLFDRELVKGKSLLQLADYATMRGLAFTRETRGETAAATILSLFDPAAPPPDRLTAFDMAYLESLYRGVPNLPAQSKLAGVSRFMGADGETADE